MTNAKNITIKFNDGTIMKKVKYYRFTDGSIKNSNIPFAYGVGYIGYGENVSEIKGNSNIVYSKWNKMLQRCYSNKYHLIKPTYKDCTVHPEWHNFQNFAKWANDKYINGFELDKDILIKGNKLYSAETCCFVPREINNLLTHNKKSRDLPIGVYQHKDKFRSYININGKLRLIGYYFTVEDAFNAYKNEKEQNIKNVANKFKNQITLECYNSLMNWTIDIND
jgi:hypothetical protein